MLTPEYIAHMCDTLAGMYDALDKAIIEELTKQIAKTGKITKIWENKTYRRRVLQEIQDETIKKVAQTTKHTVPEIRQMMKDAVDISKKLDLQPLIVSGAAVDLRVTEAQQQMINAALKSANYDINNMTATLGTSASGRYEQAVNEAFFKVANGVNSPQRAVCDAVLDIAKDGNWVMFPSGHRDRIDVATTRAVRTAISRTCGQITLDDCESFECPLVETSAHAGARLSHTYWQGRIFSLDGSHGYPDFYDETGYGEPDGLCGYNCRHSFYPFWEGLSKPAYDEDYREWAEDPEAYEYEGEKYSAYEVSQMMRKDERSIRATKRELAGVNAAIKATDDSAVEAMLTEDQVKLKARLERQKSQYEKLCKATDQRPDTARTAVYAVQDKDGNILKFDRRRGTR